MRVAALYDVHGMVHALEAVLADVAREPSTRSSSAATSSRARSRARRSSSCAGSATRTSSAATASASRTSGLREKLGARGHRVGVAAGRRRSSSTASSTATRRRGATSTILTRGRRPTSASPRRSRASTRRLVVARPHAHAVPARAVRVNAGSVGMPYEGDVAAFWAVVGDERRVPQDAVRRRARDSRHRRVGLAGRREFVAENLRAAPSRREAIEHFETRRLTASRSAASASRTASRARSSSSTRATTPERFAVGARALRRRRGGRRSSSRSAPAAGP